MTHAERIRHYSSIVTKLRIVAGGSFAVYAMFVAGIAYLLLGDFAQLIRRGREFDLILLGAMTIALLLSVWQLLLARKAYRAFDGLQAELTKGLIPKPLRPAGVPRGD